MSQREVKLYKGFDEWAWRSYDGKKSLDIKDFIETHRDRHFFIGTDSQNYKKKNRRCVFTTVLIAYCMGKGGTIATHIDKVDYVESLRQRLLIEAMRSLEVAWFLDRHVPAKNIIGIHLDVNSNLKYRSGQYKDELVGLVMSQGFRALVKPDAWAASSVADYRT